MSKNAKVLKYKCINGFYLVQCKVHFKYIIHIDTNLHLKLYTKWGLHFVLFC